MLSKGKFGRTIHRGVWYLLKGTKYPHYFFGTLTWSSRPDIAVNTAEFKLLTAFRRDYFTGKGKDGYPVKGDRILDIIGGTSLAFGDGTFTGMLWFRVIDLDEKDNWILCQAIDPLNQRTTILHTYSEPVDPYTDRPWEAVIQSCYRIGGPDHANNPEGSYRLQTLLEFNHLNNSPVAIVPVIVNLPCNSVCSFPFAAVDPDGDTLNIRLASSFEASGFIDEFVQPGPPHTPKPLTINAETSMVSWDTFGTKPGQLWSYQMIADDGKTQIGVDALIRTIEQKGKPPCCSVPGKRLKARAAVPFHLNFEASDTDGEITDVKSINLPRWASIETNSPLPSPEVTIKISGIPKFEDQGNHAVSIMVTDNDGNQAVSSFTIQVDSCSIIQFHPCQGG